MFVASFSYDVAWGKKAQVLAIVDKYRDIAAEMGFPKGRVLVGSLGVAESRIVEEYRFESLAALENAWAAMDDPRIAGCVEEMAPYVVPGSHKWEVYRIKREEGI